jgi:DNA-binding HxlR family transcriptional regulator
MLDVDLDQEHALREAAAMPVDGCPMRDVLDRVGDKWSVMVVTCLSEGPLRFNALRRRIDGISQRMLTETLRQLERDGIVLRMVYAEAPVRVEYRLTDLGRTLIAPLAALAVWAEQHRAAIVAARQRYDQAQQNESVRAL